MTGAELLGCAVYDPDGVLLGKVHDLRFAAGGPRVGDSGTPAYQLTALECGGTGLAHRLGFVGRNMAGPWPLAALMRWLSQRSVVVPCSAMRRVVDRRVEIGLRAGDLRRADKEQ
jgi:hypothetical protein